jgi:hypothetical protein
MFTTNHHISRVLYACMMPNPLSYKIAPFDFMFRKLNLHFRRVQIDLNSFLRARFEN